MFKSSKLVFTKKMFVLIFGITAFESVLATPIGTTMRGHDATLSCELTDHKKVLQVTWQKITSNSTVNVATYSERFGAKIMHNFRKHVQLREDGLQKSSLLIRGVRRDHEACYSCLFNTYPDGAISSTACLKEVFELYDPLTEVTEMMSSDHRILHVLTCSFTSRRDNDDALEGAMRLFNSGPEGTVSVIQASVRGGSQFHKTTGLISCVVSPSPLAKRKDISKTMGEIQMSYSNRNGRLLPTLGTFVIFMSGLGIHKLYDPLTEVTKTMSSDHRILHVLTCSFTSRRDNDDALEGAMRLVNSGPEGTVSVIQASVRGGYQFHKTTGLMSCVVSPPPLAKRNDVSKTMGEIQMSSSNRREVFFCICMWSAHCPRRSHLHCGIAERDTTMFDAVLPLCLQLCVSLMMLSRTRGEVTAPSRLQALVDLPFTIGCNLSMSAGESLHQVRWEDGKGQTLLSYQPDKPASISSHRVDQASSHRDTSAITIKRVELADEGLYRCLFDVYPSGQQEGRVHLSVTARVTMEGNKTAVSGNLATLSCSYGLPQKVQQVLWKKTAEQGDTSDVASFTKRAGAMVTEPFRDRISMSHALGDTRLSIKPVRTEDEGCYTCEFNTYPEGSKSAVACLTVYVLPKPEVIYRTTSPGVIEANCSALARPAAEISWNVDGNNKTLGPAMSSSFQQGDGTTLVISTLSIQAELLEDESIKCLVFHRGLDSPMSVSLNTKIGKALTILIAVTTVAAIIILCMCICICKYFLRRDD
ncbi:hypothetical protein AAFF_G00019810 [Aldrovandia affinis]|uniref:Ig-like domain-containing protein n=1 Tax=Aldrovandia affinis TaxID=143900 RepID=A0AAD7WHN5_9TELE|nr:hypothetical protein AAFF_G00019810 [Aldrovandia affinis]